MYSNKENVNILTALLVEHGVEHVVVCPGSRNAPLVHNFSECPAIVCHPATDERSAGFLAIGLRQQFDEPVAVCVTSGSALLNVLPAVAEATYQHCGIVVISADRPQAWIDQLDGQTLPQAGALGKFVGRSVNLPEPKSEDDRWLCQRLVNEAFIAYDAPHSPSIHINVPITEPLFDFTEPHLPEVRAVRCKTLMEAKDELLMIADGLEQQKAKCCRPMIVVGQTAKNALRPEAIEMLEKHCVVLYEQLAMNRRAYTDQMLYSIRKQMDEYSPDWVLYVGGHTISKRLRQFLRTVGDDAYQILVSEDGALRDVSQHTRLVVRAEAKEVIELLAENMDRVNSSAAYLDKWSQLHEAVKKATDAYQPDYSQMLAVKMFEESIGCTSAVYYANSMSVRLAAIYAHHFCYCNRGVNGIEGSLSVAAGASIAQAALNPEGITYCVIGDLSFFYDENALWQQQLGGNLRILLLNNGQGGIFRNLKGLERSGVRDSLVSAQHNANAEGVCAQFGVRYLSAKDAESLKDGIEKLHGMKSDRPVLLEVMTDVNEDEKVFKNYFRTL